MGDVIMHRLFVSTHGNMNARTHFDRSSVAAAPRSNGMCLDNQRFIRCHACCDTHTFFSSFTLIVNCQQLLYLQYRVISTLNLKP